MKNTRNCPGGNFFFEFFLIPAGSVTIPYFFARIYAIALQFILAMSQTYTFIALGALIIALILLLLYYRAETRETADAPTRRPLPGKFFIIILIACTVSGDGDNRIAGRLPALAVGIYRGPHPRYGSGDCRVPAFKEKREDTGGIIYVLFSTTGPKAILILMWQQGYLRMQCYPARTSRKCW